MHSPRVPIASSRGRVPNIRQIALRHVGENLIDSGDQDVGLRLPEHLPAAHQPHHACVNLTTRAHKTSWSHPIHQGGRPRKTRERETERERERDREMR